MKSGVDTSVLDPYRIHWTRIRIQPVAKYDTDPSLIQAKMYYDKICTKI